MNGMLVLVRRPAFFLRCGMTAKVCGSLCLETDFGGSVK